MDEEDLLESLLSVATKELAELKEKYEINLSGGHKDLKENDSVPSENAKNTSVREIKCSVIHSGDTDSSDDEERRNPEEQKYNDCGKEVRRLLNSKSLSERDKNDETSNRLSSWKKKTENQNSLAPPQATVTNKNKIDVYTDPVFGLRIINPIISSAELQQRMVGRMVLPFSRIKNFVQKKEISGDFVIAGVIINKSAVKTSQKGTQYSLWFLSDLKGDIKTISLFLFGNAHKQLWKTATGTVVGILNPSILDKKDGSKDEGCFSIDNPQMAMILGQSKDLGVCRSKKKNGEPCTAVVNLSQCEYCIYHVQQEYQKCSRRSELQSTFSGKGLTALRNKVLGKDQVFYAGKLYTAIPAKKSRKQEQKDNLRLRSLNGLNESSKNIVKAKNIISKKCSAAKLDVPLAQRKKDLEILKRLGGTKESPLEKLKSCDIISQSTSASDIQETKNIALNVISKLKEKKSSSVNTNSITNDSHACGTGQNSGISTSFVTPPKKLPFADSGSESNSGHLNIKPTLKNEAFPNIPVLGKSSNSMIDLNAPVSHRHVDRAKLNAIRYIQKNGPIKKADPNSSSSQKRKNDFENSVLTEEDKKKQKIQENQFFSERFKRMMEATSVHTDLLEQHDDEEKEKYFRKLEAKENMEEKMATTYKVACKVVRCLQCKYTSFSAADVCKAEKHLLKIYDGMKRFFKCGNCGNRVASLAVVPVGGCKNCGSGKWVKTGMKEEKIVQAKQGLSIRGGEQKFVNSVVTDANINLLVPDDG